MTASYNKNTASAQTNSNATTAENVEMKFRDIIQQGMELNTLDTSSFKTDDDSTMNEYQISLGNLPNKYYGRTMRSFYFRGGRATAVAMRQL